MSLLLKISCDTTYINHTVMVARKQHYTIYYRVAQKKAGHHAVCERNLHKLLLHNGFMLVELRCQI